MQKSSFFNSINEDRKYAAEDWAAYFSSFVSNGVFAQPSNSLQVVAASGMGITIKVGSGFINGYYYRNTTDLSKILSVADGVLNRIDRVVVRWSLVNRAMTVEVLQGAPASTPTATSLTRNAETYEIALADIYVGHGATSISQSNITDRRASSELCGFVTGVIDQFDFSTLCAQFDAFFSEYEQRVADRFDDFETLGQNRYNTLDTHMTAFEVNAKQEFDDWFANLVYVLDGDVAGHLQNEIDALESNVPDSSSDDPQMDGEASVGSSTVFAREDHVHPSDTSRADTALSNVQSGSVGTNLLAAGAATREKLGTDALYSPVVSAHSITASDIGKTIQPAWNTETNIIISQDNSDLIPKGAEFAVIRWGNDACGDVTIQGTGGVRFFLQGEPYVTNATLKIPDYCGMVALKKISISEGLGDGYLVTGNVEVVA